MMENQTANTARTATFFGLAIAISWLLWAPGVLATAGWLPQGAWLTPLGVFGPGLAALWLTGREGGRAAVAELLRRVFDVRLGWRPVLFGFGLPLLAVSSTAVALRLLAGETPDAIWTRPEFLPGALFVLPYILYLFIFEGPLGEEIGWRGYVLPRLKARRGALPASLIIGAVWGLWHLPLFFIDGTPHSAGLPFVPFVLSTLPLSVIMTWLVARAGERPFVALLFHLALNVSLLFNAWTAMSAAAWWLLLVLYMLVAFALVIRDGRQIKPLRRTEMTRN